MRRIALAALLAAGCFDAPVGTPMYHVDSEPQVNVSSKNKIDLLFLIDNSPSMLPMQQELAAKFQHLFDAFTAAAAAQKYADLHIGVVTSDFGASGARAGDSTGCDPLGGGQQGKLQALGANHAKFAADCQPPTNANFIRYSFDPNVASNNLPAGQDLVKTFGCMAAVGAGGCGFEHQLESVYTALVHPPDENKGFLRPDARLAIVFVTNEDDGSSRASDPIYDVSNAAFGPDNTYRQTMWGIACGNPEMLTPTSGTMSSLHQCGPASADVGKEQPVDRYIDGLKSVKANPNDVILVGIDALYDDAQGIDVVMSRGMDFTTVPPTTTYLPCNGVGTCQPFLQHACINATDPSFFGDPAIRVNTVVESAHVHATVSICDDDFTGAMQTIAGLITEPPAGCVPGFIPDLTNPSCVVEDETFGPDSETQPVSVTEIPRCDVAPAGAACWRVETKPACASESPQSAGVTVDRQGMTVPDGVVTVARCYTTITPGVDGGATD